MKARAINTIGRTRLLIAGLLMLLAVAACDSGPSREDFVADANEICRDSETSLEDLGGEAIAQEDPGEIIDVASEELSNLRDELGELEAPDDLSDDFDAMIEGLSAAIEDVDSLSEGVEEAGGAQPDEEILQELQDAGQSLTSNLEEAAQAARDMGVDDCGETT